MCVRARGKAILIYIKSEREEDKEKEKVRDNFILFLKYSGEGSIG